MYRKGMYTSLKDLEKERRRFNNDDKVCRLKTLQIKI